MNQEEYKKNLRVLRFLAIRGMVRARQQGFADCEYHEWKTVYTDVAAELMDVPSPRRFYVQQEQRADDAVRSHQES